MELVIKVRNDKASYLAQILEKIDYVEDVEIKYETAQKSDISEEQFLQNLRLAVSDAEDPEDAYQGVLQGLKEVELYQQGKIQPKKWDDFIKKLKEYRDTI